MHWKKTDEAGDRRRPDVADEVTQAALDHARGDRDGRLGGRHCRPGQRRLRRHRHRRHRDRRAGHRPAGGGEIHRQGGRIDKLSIGKLEIDEIEWKKRE